MLRLYEADAGCIFFNDTDIKEINIAQYRDCYGVLLQDFQMYATTIRKNIAMNSEVFQEKMSGAVKRVGFESVLNKTAYGTDSQMTKEFYDEGIDFSGGEKQRLALSRSFYQHKDIYIFDEPTSALDIRQEALFYQLIKNNAEDKTIIFTSHRLSSVKMCNKIIYMEKGEIVEQGRHQELYEMNGKYAAMFKAQERLYFQ